MPLTFQELILVVQDFWSRRGCALSQPHGVEVGAGTMNPDTFFRVLGPEPWAVAYVEPSRRPADARYGDNPLRLYKHYQFQVILKPSPADVQDIFLESLRTFGIDPRLHDVRFEEDNWEAPTLGAQGVGWQVMLDGMEITQFTYFQRAGGMDLDPVSAEITYGMERICMFLNNADSIFDLPWNRRLRYRDVRQREEWEFSKYAFEAAEVASLTEEFARSEAEARRLLEDGLVLPAYDACLRCSHYFNLLEARGAVSVTERTGYILRVRALACACAEAYLLQREQAGFPLGRVERRPAPRPLPKPRLRLRPRNEFLLEVGCEEIPAPMIPAARDALAQALVTALAERGLEPAGRPRAFSTPRRLAVWLTRVPARQAERDQEVIGPPARVAFDASGAPTAAALGFARAQGIEVSALQRLSTPRGEYVGLVRRVRGRTAPEVLQEVVPQALRGMSFSKAMRWESEPMAFVRPVRWLVALWNDQVLPLEVAGVRSGRETFGHRFLGHPRLRLGSAREYARVLKRHGVWVDDAARRRHILAALRRRAAGGGGSLLEHEPTLEEVTHLVERPLVIGGRFDPEFLVLPREVLLATMRHHQKQFGLVDRKGGLQPRFLAVADQRADRGGLIRHGNERVLRARLDDARFFWSEDRKVRLEERAPRLRGTLFHEKLGSMTQRVERMRRLAPEVGPRLPQIDLPSLERAVVLCKLDLTTEMVKEFPELQGLVGGLYAREQGEREEIASAIYDHYRPQSLEDEPPCSMLGCALSLVDRLDTLAALFAVGEAPTGSRDPFGLRRCGQGLVKILLDRGLHLPLDALLSGALDGVVAQGAALASPRAERLQAVCEFVRGRVRFLLEQAGHRYDLINAALAAGPLDPLDVRLRVAALEALKEDANFAALSTSFKRIRKILAQASEDGPLDPAALRESAERGLYERMSQARERLDGLVGRRDYPEALRTLAALRRPIDLFFDEVLVMDRDPAVRRNRVGLLRALADLFLSLADFSEVVVEGEAAA